MLHKARGLLSPFGHFEKNEGAAFAGEGYKLQSGLPLGRDTAREARVGTVRKGTPHKPNCPFARNVLQGMGCS